MSGSSTGLGLIVFFPIGHEESQARKIPIVTIGIILICSLIFVLTDKAIETEQIRQKAIVDRIQVLKTEVYLKANRQKGGDMITAWIDEDASNYHEVYSKFNERIQENWAKFIKDDQTKEDDPGYQKYLGLKEELDEISKNGIIAKHGLIPGRPTFSTLITSMFFHGSLAHLFFNMFFLYIFGFALEDVWGRVGYLVFYILAGLFAAGAHIAMNIGSQVPAIGASGAIAGLMGGFLIRFYKVKIHYEYYYFLLKVHFGKISIPSFVALPAWLAVQLFYAALAGQGQASVAFWAHIGGFGFGAMGAFALISIGFGQSSLKEAGQDRLSQLRKRPPMNIVRGMKMIEEGQYAEAAAYFATIINKNPNNLGARHERIRALFLIGDVNTIEPEIKSLVKEYINADNLPLAAKLVEESSLRLPEILFDAVTLYKVGAYYEKKWQNEFAMTFYLCSAYQDGKMRDKSFLAAARLAELRFRDRVNAVKLLKQLLRKSTQDSAISFAKIEIKRLSEGSES